MTAREPDPIPPVRCPNCGQTDRTQDATSYERARFDKPYWCQRCSLPLTGSPIEAQNWQAAREAAQTPSPREEQQ